MLRDLSLALLGGASGVRGGSAATSHAKDHLMTTQSFRTLHPVESDTAGATTRLVVISAGVSDPSTTRLLADRTAQKAIDLLRDAGSDATVNVIELSGLAVEIAQAIVSGFPGERLQAAIELLAGADAVIASTPVYKAGISGLFKSFADVLDNDLLIGKPVILAATAGTPRHAMVVDEQLRPLFAFLRALPVPTSLFAAPDDWGSSDSRRPDRTCGHGTDDAREQRRRSVHGRRRVVGIPAPVLGQRDEVRSIRRRCRLQHRPDEARRRRNTLTMAVTRT